VGAGVVVLGGWCAAVCIRGCCCVYWLLCPWLLGGNGKERMNNKTSIPTQIISPPLIKGGGI
jgi:hypothetical protein